MPDPAPTRRESSKAVPVGEPPTPEGWTSGDTGMLVDALEHYADSRLKVARRRDKREGGMLVEKAIWPAVEKMRSMANDLRYSRVRVAPVGGAGQEGDVETLAEARGFSDWLARRGLTVAEVQATLSASEGMADLPTEGDR